MLCLAIECSGIHGSVALLSGSEFVSQLALPTNQSSVQTLAQTIAIAMQRVDTKPDFISVTSGPGSFTGLRVGMATAKMLGLAWRIPIVGVDTLEVLAHQMNCRIDDASSAIIVPVLNAFRRQVFTAAWRPESPETIMRLSPSQTVDADEWVQDPFGSQAMDAASDICNKTVLVGGPGLDAYRPALVGNVRQPTMVVLEGIHPTAASLAKIGGANWAAGNFSTAEELTANYIRSSAAEEHQKGPR